MTCVLFIFVNLIFVQGVLLCPVAFGWLSKNVFLNSNERSEAVPLTNVAGRWLLATGEAQLVWSQQKKQRSEVVQQLRSVKHFSIFDRFLAESSNSRLLEHVGKVDELHGLPKKKGVTTTKQQTGDVMLLPPTPKSR